jgi:7-cyano-7-deazaguanine synthase in queuosine biosynthesis
LIDFAEYIVGCKGVKPNKTRKVKKYLELEHREGKKNRNARIKLNNFVNDCYKLSNRVKDLLELAGYLFAADRKTLRGKNDAVEYHSWARSFNIHIGVRDLRFWNKPEIQEILEEALRFMTGDHSYKFTFYKAEPDPPANIFDNEDFVIEKPENFEVMLFSGGLDSLSGAIELLETTNAEVCLVSHQSGNLSSTKTQRILYQELNGLYTKERVKHYKFECGLSVDDSKDETQRTRSFLYTSIAFALANTYNHNRIYLFENGITSINFAETQDLMNARASRTTHPQTMYWLQKLFSAIAEKQFKIINPYLFKTKTEVVEVLKHHNRLDLLDSSISCSRTRTHPAGFTHCGICSQCIDRRFAVYAADIQKNDGSHLYHFNFLEENLESDEAKKALTEYIRLAQNFSKQNIDSWYRERGYEIILVEKYLDGTDENERIEKIFDLCQRHAQNIDTALRRMRYYYDLPLEQSRKLSFFNVIVDQRTYLNSDNGNGEAKNISEYKEIPTRGLKKLVAETCEFLIKQNVIKEIITDTKKNPVLGNLIIKTLKKEKYELTIQNENSIKDYFRKFEIQLKKDGNGNIVVE